mmetsp:Transcript_155980/g.275650  ORF Transcript_155980/g.275650 Transcript_155980/m.275650 type:complete len:309 (+) Transcript_155980:55-981(+)
MGKHISRQHGVSSSDGEAKARGSETSGDFSAESSQVADSVTDSSKEHSGEASSQMDTGDSISVVVVKPGGQTLNLEMCHKMTIKHVKGEIDTQWQVSAAFQKLIKNTEVAQDGETLSSLASDGIVELTLVVQTFIAGPLAEGIEQGCFYYIQPARLSDDMCLNAITSGLQDDSTGLVRYRPHMAAIDASQGVNQTWRILKLDNSRFGETRTSFRLTPRCFLDQADLDLLNPSQQPCFREWGGYTGQRWRLEEVEGGYRMSTQYTPSLYLTVDDKSEFPSMQPWAGNGDGNTAVVQVWSVRKCLLSSAS